MLKASPDRRAVFLDRDGVLNVDSDYVYKISDLIIPNGVAQATKDLVDAGYLLIVVTNQSGVARGYYTLEDVERFNSELSARILSAGGGEIEKFYICPYHEKGSVEPYNQSSNMRKPNTGMLDAAKAEFGIDFGSSYMVGDKFSDIECAVRAGVSGLQVNLKGEKHPKALGWFEDLAEASRYILRQ